VFKFEVPSLKENITKIASSLFVLLKNYAVAGGAKGENFDLVVVCFKVNVYFKNHYSILF
jgi:U3 small nucleolar RNA-associated protein 20